MNLPKPLGIAVWLFAVNTPMFVSATEASPFDTPLKEKVVDYGPSPYYPGPNAPHKKLSCYFYLTFMVKQYDEGQKGAEWLAIVPIKNQSVPACSRSYIPGERRVKDWNGYFKGVKDNIVFFDAADGINGGLPFVAYDSRTGQKIFEDSAELLTGDDFRNNIRISTSQNGGLILRYQRVVGTECDIYHNSGATAYNLHTPSAPCWEQIKKQFDIKSARQPVCTGYEEIQKRGDWASSAIAYPVEVALPHPAIKATEGPVRCWPVD